MLGAAIWRVGGHWSLLTALVLAGVGCQSSSSSNPPKLAIVDKKEPSPDAAMNDQSKPPDQFIHDILTGLNKGKASPEWLTTAFMKKIARPRAGNEEDRKLGYDPERVTEYLAKIKSGTYPEKFTL